MKSNLPRTAIAALVMTLISNGVNADTAIPAQFHGIRGTAASCTAWVAKPSERLGAPEEGAEITAREIQFGESSCELKRCRQAFTSSKTLLHNEAMRQFQRLPPDS